MRSAMVIFFSPPAFCARISIAVSLKTKMIFPLVSHREVVGTVPVEGNTIPYVHDFSMTENYIILCIWPVRIDLITMVTSDRGFLRELDWCKADGPGS